ncbi:hypothetical protein D9M72_520970 [compost metagenome]
MVDGALPPGAEFGVREDVARDGRDAGTDGGTGGAASALAIGPGDVERLDILLVESNVSQGCHRLCFVMLGAPDPGHAIATFLHHHPADFLEQEARVFGA